MKTNILSFLQASREQNHNLNSLIALVRTFKQLNLEIELTPIEEIEFTDLESFPDPRHADFFTDKQIQEYVEQKNKFEKGKEF